MLEHFLIPRTHLELSGDHYFHGATAQGFVAGATSRITIGSLVTLLPLHHPVIAAKAIATLDWLSGAARVDTVGVGWLKEEYDVLGVPFAKRGRMADEYLAAMLELWHSDPPSFDGEFVSFHDVALRPKPIQTPHPPKRSPSEARPIAPRMNASAAGPATPATPARRHPATAPRRERVLRRDNHQCRLRYPSICTDTATIVDHIVDPRCADQRVLPERE